MLPHERGSSFKRTCEMLDRVPDLPLALLHLRRRQAALLDRSHAVPMGDAKIRPLDAPFEIPSSFRHSAAPSDSTVLQHQRANYHISLEGSTMMIVDTLLEGVHSQCFMCSHRECRARSCHCAHLRPLQDLRYRFFGRGDSNSGHPARLASILPLYYVFASLLSANPYVSVYTLKRTK